MQNAKWVGTFAIANFALLTLHFTFPFHPPSHSVMHPAERQLTHGPGNKNLDNNINFSPDGKWLVFDCRGDKGIGGNTRLGRVNVQTGETILFYDQKPPVSGVGAASFLNNREVIAIHSLTNGLVYDVSVRGGM